ncbi:MAG: magnesium transporter [Phycisphaerales bacterium]
MPDDTHDALDAREIRELIARGDARMAAARYVEFHASPEDARSLFGQLDASEASALLLAIEDERIARELLLWLPREQAAPLASAIPAAEAGRLIGGLPSDERADLLAAVEEPARGAIQAALPATARADAARLLTYQSDSAGGLMETEFLAFHADTSVREAIRDIRANQQQYSAIGVQYLYLLDGDRRLAGVAPIRDLVLAPEAATLASLIRHPPTTVRDSASARDVATLFDEHPFMALPVVDARGVMLGVVTRADATESEQEQAEDLYRVSQGIVGGEELRSMPVVLRFRRRGAWLAVNLGLCLCGAAVIAAHEDTLASALVVAAVLPVVSATSGNAAMQAAAVSIRELTLGIIDPASWRRVLVHELALALLVAVPLGGALACLSRAWGAAWTIGAAVGAAMAINVVIAIAVGALCPLVLRRFKVDPALATGPISTTLADVSGFGLTLGLVAWSTP